MDYLVQTKWAESFLSYDNAVIQWLTSCHKNSMTTLYITLGYWHVTSDAVRDNVMFSIESMSTFKAIKSHLKMSYELLHDKTNKVSVRPAKTQISLGIRPV